MSALNSSLLLFKSAFDSMLDRGDKKLVMLPLCMPLNELDGTMIDGKSSGEKLVCGKLVARSISNSSCCGSCGIESSGVGGRCVWVTSIAFRESRKASISIGAVVVIVKG
jgi:hypothetical protein